MDEIRGFRYNSNKFTILGREKVFKNFKKMSPKNGVRSQFSLFLPKSSKTANCIFQPVCLWVQHLVPRTEAPGGTKWTRTIAEKQSQLPATRASQGKSTFSPQNLKANLHQKTPPKTTCEPKNGRFSAGSGPFRHPKIGHETVSTYTDTKFSKNRCLVLLPEIDFFSTKLDFFSKENPFFFDFALIKNHKKYFALKTFKVKRFFHNDVSGIMTPERDLHESRSKGGTLM